MEVNSQMAIVVKRVGEGLSIWSKVCEEEAEDCPLLIGAGEERETKGNIIKNLNSVSLIKACNGGK